VNRYDKLNETRTRRFGRHISSLWFSPKASRCYLALFADDTADRGFAPRVLVQSGYGAPRQVWLTLRLSRRGPPGAGLTGVRFAPEPASERGRVGLSRELGGVLLWTGSAEMWPRK